MTEKVLDRCRPPPLLTISFEDDLSCRLVPGRMQNAILDIPPTLSDERRRSPRIQFSKAVELVSEDFPQLAQLTELSRDGARLQVARPIEAGRTITIRRGDVELEGVVAWSRGRAIGIRLRQPLPELVFLKLRRDAYLAAS